jgi:hypothetical protein
VEKVAQNVDYFCNFQKLSQSKQSNKDTKFAQPGHPGRERESIQEKIVGGTKEKRKRRKKEREEGKERKDRTDELEIFILEPILRL